MSARALLAALLLAACSDDSAASDAGSIDGPATDAPPGTADAPPGTIDAAPTADASLPPLTSTARYYGNRVGLTTEVSDHLRAVAGLSATPDDAVFIKVGDSITVNSNFFACFAAASGATIDLDGRDLAATITHFDDVALPGPSTSWDRESLAAQVGVGTAWALEGDPAPLIQEIDASNPRFAVIMLGTNDNSGSTFEWWLGARAYRDYAYQFLMLLDALESRGVVPIVTYIPPVLSEPAREWLTPAFVATLRGVATARLVPTIDFYTDMAALGASAYGGDGVHPNADPDSACVLTAAGLAYGYDIRNLRSLEVLDKVRRVVLDGAASADPEAPLLAGAGTAADPVQIPGLPFASRIDTTTGEDVLADYAACGGHDGATAGDHVFRLTVAEATPIRAIVVPPTGACDASEGDFPDCDSSTDVSVALFRDGLAAGDCLAAHSTLVARLLQPGHTYYLVVDAFPAERPDFAILSVHRCHPDDTDCQTE
jgi:hypothetical protein